MDTTSETKNTSKPLNSNALKSNVLKKLIGFSLPYLLSCFMQTLYGMADLFIVGQFNGVESTTAVSVGSQVMHMLTVIIIGLAMGSTVLIGNAFGAKNKKLMSDAIGSTIVLFAVLSAFLTVILLFLTTPILNLMSVPPEAFSGASSYLTICFIGIPFVTAYNVISSVFRGMGDSKTPMYFVAVACVSNIILDFIFIGRLKMGPAGAALGTTLSQAISVLISIFAIVKKDMGISIKLKNLRPSKSVYARLIKVGLPVSLQDGFVQISFLLITMFANLRGLEDAAAVGIVEKIISILFLVPSAMLSSVSALSSQYIGANDNKSAKLTLRLGIILCVAFGIISVITMQIGAEKFVDLFTDDSAAILMGGQYMRGYVWDCILAGIHFCFSGYFCACGLSGLSFLHNCASILLARIPLAYLASVHFTDTLFPMGLATTTGSCISVIICLIAYAYINKHPIKVSA